jgi:hypothetical protein
MSRTDMKSLSNRRGAGLALAAMVALGLTSPAFAQSKAELAQACSDAAHQWFENFNAPTDMRADDPRVDGTRTAGGTIDLGNYVAEIRCGYPAKKFHLTEFYVDGVSKLKDLQAGRTFRN